MGYRPRIRSSRASGRGSSAPRREKAKARGRKRRSVASSRWEEKYVATAEEVADRVLTRLHNLGSQTFASSPYSDHLSRWLVDLASVLSDFESSPTIGPDDQFMSERSQILLNVELEIEERRHKETAFNEAVKTLSDGKALLQRIEEEYAFAANEIRERKNSEIKRLKSNVKGLQAELDEISRMKTGLFRGISKEAKAQKEIEATQRLNTTRKELELATQGFVAEEERLREEYEKKKQTVIEQTEERRREMEDLETDGSLEGRRVACEALINAVNALLQRKSLQAH